MAGGILCRPKPGKSVQINPRVPWGGAVFGHRFFPEQRPGRGGHENVDGSPAPNWHCHSAGTDLLALYQREPERSRPGLTRLLSSRTLHSFGEQCPLGSDALPQRVAEIAMAPPGQEAAMIAGVGVRTSAYRAHSRTAPRERPQGRLREVSSPKVFARCGRAESGSQYRAGSLVARFGHMR